MPPVRRPSCTSRRARPISRCPWRSGLSAGRVDDPRRALLRRLHQVLVRAARRVLDERLLVGVVGEDLRVDAACTRRRRCTARCRARAPGSFRRRRAAAAPAPFPPATLPGATRHRRGECEPRRHRPRRGRPVPPPILPARSRRDRRRSISSRVHLGLRRPRARARSIVQKSRRSSHDSTIVLSTSSRDSCCLRSTDQMYGNLPSRSAASSSRNSASGTMFSFQVSRGAFLKCLRKRASVTAKSAKVSGSSIVAGSPFLVDVLERVGRPLLRRAPGCLRGRGTPPSVLPVVRVVPEQRVGARFDRQLGLLLAPCRRRCRVRAARACRC